MKFFAIALLLGCSAERSPQLGRVASDAAVAEQSYDRGVAGAAGRYDAGDAVLSLARRVLDASIAQEAAPLTDPQLDQDAGERAVVCTSFELVGKPCMGSCRGSCSGDCDRIATDDAGVQQCEGACDGRCLGTCVVCE